MSPCGSVAALVIALCTLASCAKLESGSASARGQAGFVPVVNERPATVLDRLRLFKPLDEAVDSAQPLREAGGAFRLLDERPAAILAILPARAREPLRVQAADDPAFWIDIVSEDAEDADGRLVGSAIVYEGALRGATLVRLLRPAMAEELRFVERADAPSTMRYRLKRGPHVGHIEVQRDQVRIQDSSGRTKLASAPIFAVDSMGATRRLRVQLIEEGEAVLIEAVLQTGGLVYPIAIDPAWTSGGDLNGMRALHAAAALVDGSVLVSGGLDPQAQSEDREFMRSDAVSWVSIQSGWTGAGQMTTSRMQHTLTPLADGDALAVGGLDGSYMILGSSQRFTPPSTWRAETQLATPRYSHTASLLPNGQVLVVGGNGPRDDGAQQHLQSAEIYDPVVDRWTPVASLATARQAHAAAVITKNGHTAVLVVGGLAAGPANSDVPLDSVEVWDGSAWSLATPMHVPRYFHTATTLPLNRVLVTGGQSDLNSGNSRDDAEVYDPDNGPGGAWTPVANPMSAARSQHAAILIGRVGEERVLVVGGGTEKRVDLYDPDGNVFRPSEPLVQGRYQLTLTSVGGFRALVVGGQDPGTGVLPTELFDPSPDGTPCEVGSKCATGICQDGVCCSAACTGPCQACNLDGHVGTCSPVSGSIRLPRTPCGADSAYLCANGVCGTSCVDDQACSADFYCGVNVCTQRKPEATVCSRDAECQLGFCVLDGVGDGGAFGVCCNTRCDDLCRACGEPGHEGRCELISGKPRGRRQDCGDGTSCGFSCNGVDSAACHYPEGNPCGEPACRDRLATYQAATCSAGACVDSPVECGLYQCDATACKIRCDTSDDCIATHYCSLEGTCIPRGGPGSACSLEVQCNAPYHCNGNDGVCCDVAECPPGLVCNGERGAGSCTKPAGTSCAADSECGTGFCSDHVCCKERCDGVCEQCDQQPSLGSCVPVSGPPVHGACPAAEGGDPCRGRVCDGSQDRTQCVAYVGSEVVCRSASCTQDDVGAAQTEEARCDGSGMCPARMTNRCGAFACGATACKTSCTDNADCASGNQCVRGECISVDPICDGSRILEPDGGRIDCHEYKCGPGPQCLKTCSSDDDCAPGHVCNSQRQCVLTSEGAAFSDPGCTCGFLGRAGRTPHDFTPIALLAVFLARRRRARRGENQNS